MSIVELAQKTLAGRIKNARYENPVITKELRSRMRGARAHQIMMAYVLLMAIVLFCIYYSQWMDVAGSADPQSWFDSRLGFRLFSSLTWLQAVLIGLIAPSLTSGCITIEKEQQTIEMLSLTTLSARNIIVGKLMSGYLFVLMLLACSLPLAGMCLMFGSVSPAEIAVTYLILAAWAFLFSSIGVFCSAQFKKTATASLIAFGTVFIYAFLTTLWAAECKYGHNTNSILGGLSGCMALDHSLDMAQVFYIRLPVALAGIAINTAIGILLAVLATTRLPFHRIDRAVLIRTMLLGISLATLFLFVGNALSGLLGTTPGQESDFATFMFVILLAVFIPAVPIFSTGPIGKNANPVSSLTREPIFRKAFENRPAGGLFFLALWWAAACAVVIATFAYANSYSPVGSTGTYSFDLVNILQASIGLLGAIIAWGAIGMLFSSIMPNKNSAVVLVLLIIALAWAIYPLMLWQHESSYNYTWENQSGIMWQAAYLWPGTTIGEMSGGWHPGSTGPILWLDKGLTGVGCLAAWGIVAVIALSLSGKYYKRGRGIPDE
ncbi:MAG: ABC transporter permease subunit [Armatimonadota bacterium]